MLASAVRLSGIGPWTTVAPVAALVAVWLRLTYSFGENVLPPSMLVATSVDRPAPRGVVAGVEPRDGERPGRLVDRHLGLELGPAGHLVADIRHRVGRGPRVALGLAVEQRVVVVDPGRQRPALAAVVGGDELDVAVVGRVVRVGDRVDVIDVGQVEPPLELAEGAQGVVRGEDRGRRDQLLGGAAGAADRQVEAGRRRHVVAVRRRPRRGADRPVLQERRRAAVDVVDDPQRPGPVELGGRRAVVARQRRAAQAPARAGTGR